MARLGQKSNRYRASYLARVATTQPYYNTTGLRAASRTYINYTSSVPKGPPGPQGIPGPQGTQGKSFEIDITYNTLALLLADTPANKTFGMVAGTLSQQDADYGKVYYYGDSTSGWQFVADMSVAGLQGDPGTQGGTWTGHIDMDGYKVIDAIIENASEATIGNLKLDGNTLSSTNTNGDIRIEPNGSGDIILKGDNNTKIITTDYVDFLDSTETYTSLRINTSTGDGWAIGHNTTNGATFKPHGGGDAMIYSDTGALVLQGATSLKLNGFLDPDGTAITRSRGMATGSVHSTTNDHTTGTYNDVVFNSYPSTSENGSGAKGTVVVDASGVITSVTITEGGYNYKTNYFFEIPVATIGGTLAVGKTLTLETSNTGIYLDTPPGSANAGEFKVPTTAAVEQFLHEQNYVSKNAPSLLDDLDMNNNKIIDVSDIETDQLTMSGNIEFNGGDAIDIGELNFNAGGNTVTNIHDEDDMASDDPAALATQQSIKAYVDAEVDAASSANVVAALDADLGGDFKIGNQNDDECTFSGPIVTEGTLTVDQDAHIDAHLTVGTGKIEGGDISTTGSNDNITFSPHGTGIVKINSELDMEQNDITDVNDIVAGKLTVDQIDIDLYKIKNNISAGSGGTIQIEPQSAYCSNGSYFSQSTCEGASATWVHAKAVWIGDKDGEGQYLQIKPTAAETTTLEAKNTSNLRLKSNGTDEKIYMASDVMGLGSNGYDHLMIIPSDWMPADSSSTYNAGIYDFGTSASVGAVRPMSSYLELWAFKQIPKGYKATSLDIWLSHKLSADNTEIVVWEKYWNNTAPVNRGSVNCTGNIGYALYQLDFTDITSSADNMIALQLDPAGNTTQILGAKIYIEEA